jgi:hypothetical protein
MATSVARSGVRAANISGWTSLVGDRTDEPVR